VNCGGLAKCALEKPSWDNRYIITHFSGQGEKKESIRQEHSLDE